LRNLGSAKLSGEVYYDGDNIRSGKFLPFKISDYIEQGDTHEAVLTVEETLKFAWLCTTGGHHSYSRAKEGEKGAEATAFLNQDDSRFALIHNILFALGLMEAKDTYVGNDAVRGISGGQKRRVTIGEMVACPRPVKMMDCISNGLDTATTYDIIRAMSYINHTLGVTTLIALLQVIY
jgi:ABC-type multidrug transport system ATPase subunit